MDANTIVSIITLALVYGGAMIGFWINIKVKINALEIKMVANKHEYDRHVATAKEEKEFIHERISENYKCNSDEHHLIMDKQDSLLEILNEMKIEIAKLKVK